MLSVQLKEGKQGKKRKEAEVKEKLNQAIAAGEKLTNELWREVNEVGRKVYEAEKELESDLKTVESEISKFQLESKQWVSLVHSLGSELKPLGDVTNWLEHTEESLMQCAEDINQLLSSDDSDVATDTSASSPG